MPERTGRAGSSRERSERIRSLIDRIAEPQDEARHAATVHRTDPTVERLLDQIFLADDTEMNADRADERRAA